ncbi:MAG: glycosyltransferase [Bacteroidales bacterium]|nr:glycosyltransferase [Bacteroidales bacterium]MBN2819992.1 glycosyltransferase [Bacteroidales bacterium]
MIISFWIAVLVIIYSYLGYTLLLFVLSLFYRKRKFTEYTENEFPEVTLLIAVYNEKDILEEKIKNSFSLTYPKEKLKHLWITDGTTDGSTEILKSYSQFEVLHTDQRKGKTAALNRAMNFVKTPYTVFTDANTMLKPNTIEQLVKHFQDKRVGCVAGEKKIISTAKDNAAGSGEGLYWNYESLLKKLEARVGSVLGAAGELYAIQTKLYEAPDEKFVLDDFIVSMNIAQKGYKIDYEAKACAIENASYNITEEMKRKVRIAAGGFQVLFSKFSLLNFTKHFMLSFQYLSHKVLRWFLVPFAFVFLFIINVLIVVQTGEFNLYAILFILQLIFYLVALLGGIYQKQILGFKVLFLPFYICVMNYSIIKGFVRFLTGKQKAAWEKAHRN